MNSTLSISILIVIYTIIAMFSFKLLSLDVFISDDKDDNYMYSDNKFLRHKQSNYGEFWNIVLNSGVCQLGKFGIIVLIIWSIVLISLLIVYNKDDKDDKDDKDNIKKSLKILGSINLSFFIIYGILTYLMNWPLFVRCIPYLILQLAISIWILLL